MVRTGLERWLREPRRWTGGERVGLLCHAASVTADLTHAAAACWAHPAIELTALFGPQHGLSTHTQDNMVEWRSGRDAHTGIPLYSLYGEVRKPTPQMLAEVDTLVVDLQDVGTRVYTYLWTLAHVLEAAAEAGKRVVVLDRPNPIGAAVEGPLLQPAYASFVGLYPLPLRHGLTLGELAAYLNTEHQLGADLTVVELEGWRREQWFDQTGLPWVMPSPNMPTLETAAVYPGAVLVEGTTLSEGRGTTRPFELLGAPGIDPDALTARLTSLALPGVSFRPATFQPTFQKHAGQLCGGLQMHVIDRRLFQPVLTTALVLSAIWADWPTTVRWLEPPYEYVHDRLPIDLLAGHPGLREGVEQGRTAGEWLAHWRAERAPFEAARTAYLRYP
ncbi:MAG: DUF1343 domain-containing protein [Armatimonadetes bacterium]|nr:DUF1343 domain-containing protein [Armatimonadota bacterium]